AFSFARCASGTPMDAMQTKIASLPLARSFGAPYSPFEILQRSSQPLCAVDLRVPVQQPAGAVDVRAADPGIVLGQWLERNRALTFGQAQDLLGEIQNADLVGVAEVYRLVKVGVQQ